MAGATIRPTSLDALQDAIADALRSGGKLAIRGGGSHNGTGAPVGDATPVLDMRGFTGIVDYDPAELVLTARAGTPLADLLDTVAGEGQMLAFEPYDPAPLFGKAAGAATIGGTVAAGTSGPLRLTRGAARDHLLGVKGVSGRGDVFIGGAKVVKNVTGYDLPKLIAGSWGRLAALSEVTLKVLPAPTMRATRLILGLSAQAAVAVMARALGSQAEVSAAAHVDAYAPLGGRSVTALRVPGFPASVAARCALLDTLLADHGPLERIEGADCAALWRDIMLAAPLDPALPLWRISIAARHAAMVAEGIGALGGRWLMDWGGALVWATADADADAFRALAERAGGHARLVRAPAALRAAVPAFHPPADGVAALEARVRRAFDPAGLFETGRF